MNESARLRWRTVANYVLPLFLIWGGLAVMFFLPIRWIDLRDYGVALPVGRILAIAWGILMPLVPYLIACVLVWRLGLSKNSRYRWGALLFGAIAFVTRSMLFVTVTGYLAIMPSYGIEQAVWILLLPAGLTVSLGLIAAEPFSSMLLSRRLQSAAFGFAVLVVLLVALSPKSPPAPEWLVIFTYPVYLLHMITFFGFSWSTGLIMTEFHADSVAALALMDSFWVFAFWFLVARTVLAWFRVRASSVTAIAPPETVASST